MARTPVLFVAVLLVAFAVCMASANWGGSMSIQWSRGGCEGNYCETGWFSSPAVGDIDDDGEVDVFASAYDVYRLKGSDGTTVWRKSNPTGGRTWPGVILADVDGDGAKDLVTAHDGPAVVLWEPAGGEQRWHKDGGCGTGEFRALAAADMDGDGKLEVVVGRTQSCSSTYGGQNTVIYNSKGDKLDGWPQSSRGGAPETGYAAGIYNNNLMIGDLAADDDDYLEVAVPSDVTYIQMYHLNGTVVPASPLYGGRVWGAVQMYISVADELRGFGDCSANTSAPPTPRTNFADGVAVLADVDGSGVPEVVAVGNTHNCRTSPYTDLYITPWIFNLDRSRYVNTSAAGANWTTPFVDGAAGPVAEDYNIIENCEFFPTVVDLDGDGLKEIIYPAFDASINIVNLAKTNLKRSLYVSAGHYEYSSEALVADLDNDGTAEIIVTTWTPKASNDSGRVLVLDNTGNILEQIDIPRSQGDTYSGALGAGVLANIDDDPELELVFVSINAGVVAVEFSDSSTARLLWPTSKGNVQRTGGVAIPRSTSSSGPAGGSSSSASHLVAHSVMALTAAVALLM